MKDFGKESGKVLGIKWDLDEDSFYFTTNELECTENGESLTRRVMLSKIAGIYDLQGIIDPIMLQGKLILQEATRRQLQWDEPVTNDLAKEWDKWVLSMKNISDLKIPRCFKPTDFDDAYLELHHYSDASEKAYGCCTYLRAVNRWGAIHTDLIVSKTKIAPLKTVSIPTCRLELQGAVLAAKMDSLLKRELDIDLQESWFWTDSEVVLKYLANESKRFSVFVSNRISIIRNLSNVSQWNYVVGLDNPADILSRGQSLSMLDLNKWFKGPDMLRQHKCDWNIRKLDKKLSSQDPEVRKSRTVTVNMVKTKFEDPLQKIIEHYSSYFRMQNGCFHVRTDWTLALLREKYWIVKAKKG